jgi:aspartyl-tRNA(Asn)/glutamyl-tRNA(Gln) amidotransferase subunit B
MTGSEGPKRVKIGLEIHCQLTKLKTKLFCPCSSDYREKEANELVCPTCFGIPGTLPVLNGKAVEYAIRIGASLNCKIAGETSFYRKNYFYPDLTKNFQISQYDKAGGVPIASNGHVQLERKKVRIRRIQLEEDPGKLTYEGTIEKSPYSLVDYNRAGIALVEIVTEPDFESAREAKAFLEKLRAMVEALGVSDGELEGAMRCDANVSVSGGGRVEVKNISSFKEVEKALNYEILRQSTFSGTDASAVNETRHWDERRSITISLRLKEGEQDYRYFPEPDLPAVTLTAEYVAGVGKDTPEVSEVRAARYMKEYGLAAQIAGELSKDVALSRFFEETAAVYKSGPEVANWVMGESREQIQRMLAGEGKVVSPQSLSELLRMVETGGVTRTQARAVFRDMLATGRTASEVAGGADVGVVSDEGAIGRLVEKVLAESGVADEAKTNPKAFNYLIGQVLKAERKADPKVVAKVIRKKLG